MDISTREVDVLLKDETGKVICDKKGFVIPEAWSDTAARIVASKYAAANENSAVDIIARIVTTITKWGAKGAYFKKGEKNQFEADLTDILLTQRASFNSPVWFNFGIEGQQQQGSACFILDVEDNMEDILDFNKREGLIFRNGSGSGVNVSKLRGEGEALSNKGTSSGPLSFMKMWDRTAASIKSGGRTRRSAKLVCMNADHPDIEAFVCCKTNEEKKATLLMEAGLSIDEAYSAVSYQNANHSIVVDNDFMHCYEEDKLWDLKRRTDGSVCNSISARKLIRTIATMAHQTGDPGIIFFDAINEANTIPSVGPIMNPNPCQPGFATVLTPEGIKTFDDIDVGSKIWSGKQWTNVIRKIPTGTKKVYEYKTTSGSFVGTKNHRVFQNGTRVEAKDAESIDICKGPSVCEELLAIDHQDVVDGWVFGDGSVHKASNNLVYLYLGEEDLDVFSKKYSPFVVRHRPGLKETAWEVETTIRHYEIPKTYEREVPDRFFHGDKSTTVGFLKGLYNANGSVCGGRITLKASSFTVIKQVQQMLSSLGISSYYTTNKKHSVEFENGIYECKESYDLNISTSRKEFARLIGFDHESKKQRLEETLKLRSNGTTKTTYEVQSVFELGEFPVWDITVQDDEHSYWTGGLLVSNCGEFLAPVNSSCNLASLNLMKYLVAENHQFNFSKMQRDIHTLITAMDIIVDNAHYPTIEISNMTKRTRPLGLGFANLGAVLMELDLPYDSDEARDLASNLQQAITEFAYQCGVKLAKKIGPFFHFVNNKSAVVDTAIKLGVSQTIVDSIIRHGVRNSQYTLVAPTGTIGFQMDCDTTGIEPLVELKWVKKMVDGTQMTVFPPVVQRALARFGLKDIDDIDSLPPEKKAIFATSNEISVDGHLKMMAAVQKHINGAISKTINMAETATIEEVEEAYIKAWKLGLKSATIYRDKSKMWQPLNKIEKKTTTKKPQENTASEVYVPTQSVVVYKTDRRRLEDTREAKTHKFNIAGFKGYLTPGMYEDGKLGEIFIRAQKQGSTILGLMDAFATVTSMALQYGVPLEDLAEMFVNTRFDPAGVTSNPKIPFTTSPLDYIFRWLSMEFLDTEQLSLPLISEKKAIDPQKSIDFSGPPCECGGITARAGTCWCCRDCGTTTGCS